MDWQVLKSNAKILIKTDLLILKLEGVEIMSQMVILPLLGNF